MKILIEKAETEDSRRLSDISILSFHSDLELDSVHPDFPASAGGPPGYDSEEWHLGVIRKGIVWKLVLDKEIIGGVIAYSVGNGTNELGRIFLDPDFTHRGYGLEAMKLIEDILPAKKWILDTPAWNIRTRNFYQKAGYRIVREQDGCIFFEKKPAGP